VVLGRAVASSRREARAVLSVFDDVDLVCDFRLWELCGVD
jgi:hypothetical protein